AIRILEYEVYFRRGKPRIDRYGNKSGEGTSKIGFVEERAVRSQDCYVVTGCDTQGMKTGCRPAHSSADFRIGARDRPVDDGGPAAGKSIGVKQKIMEQHRQGSQVRLANGMSAL
ncbi:MAG: hypothetical protein VW709_12220, partial [Rickettsiales bacterium]